MELPLRRVPSSISGEVRILLLCSLLFLSSRRNAAATSAASAAAASSSASSMGSCPKSCFCNALNKIVYCSRRGMSAIPEGISVETLQLNLNGNSFQSATIARANFSRLVYLEHLYLSECGIEMLDVDTFVDLANLKWLDLSNNRLRVLMQYTFRGLTLEHLFLNGNRNIQLLPGSFDGLVSTGLYLHDCSLKSLNPDVFESLNDTLRNLWLNGNELEKLDKSFSGMFYNFLHLRLGSNPLHCGCEAVWLKEFYDKNGEVFKGALQPSCFAPARLKGKYFNELSLFDFRCQSPVFSNIDIMFNDTLGRLKCSAAGDPTPTLFWIQPTGKTTKYPPPAPEDSTTGRRNEAVLLLLPHHHSPEALGMTGMYICVANNEAGNVTLAVNVSWPTGRSAPLLHHLTPSYSYSPSSSAEFFSPPQSLDNEPSPPGDDNRHPPDVISGGNGSLNAGRVGLSATSMFYPAAPRDAASGEKAAAADNPADAPTSHMGRGLGPGAVALGQRMFSVAELVCAVVVTHLCTLIASLIFIGIFYYRRRSKLTQQQQLLPTSDLYRQPIHRGLISKPPYGPGSDDHDDALYRNHSSLYHQTSGCGTPGGHRITHQSPLCQRITQ